MQLLLLSKVHPVYEIFLLKDIPTLVPIKLGLNLHPKSNINRMQNDS